MLKDDRKTINNSNRVLVGGYDRFMSGWGGAKGGRSYAYWACSVEDMHLVEAWVKNRGDIRLKMFNKRDGQGKNHCHIYEMNRDRHPAFKNKEVPA